MLFLLLFFGWWKKSLEKGCHILIPSTHNPPKNKVSMFEFCFSYCFFWGGKNPWSKGVTFWSLQLTTPQRIRWAGLNFVSLTNFLGVEKILGVKVSHFDPFNSQPPKRIRWASLSSVSLPFFGGVEKNPWSKGLKYWSLQLTNPPKRKWRGFIFLLGLIFSGGLKPLQEGCI